MTEVAREFLFATCQIGAESALKEEVARLWPGFRFSYSRPGFLTFRLSEGFKAEGFELGATFARAWGFSIGKTKSETIEERARDVWGLAEEGNAGEIAAVHVFPRDTVAPTERDYNPGLNDASRAAFDAIQAARPVKYTDPLPMFAREGMRVLDCVMVEENEWWIGVHMANDAVSRAPGGLGEAPKPEEAVSRAFMKMEESLAWSGFELKAGDRATELGCAPGGSCQALLNRGLIVMGIDPAAVDDAVAAHPNFTHVRKRAMDVRRKEFRKTKLLAADMNVAPAYTLDTVEAIVTNPETRPRWLLLTLKLPEWSLASDLPAWLERVASWGYTEIRARQLAHHRREICVAAKVKPKPRVRSKGVGRGRAGTKRKLPTD